MKKQIIRLLAALLLLALCLPFAAAGAEAQQQSEILVEDGIALTDELIVEYGEDYTDKDEVALYLHVFGELPPNFITKNEAMDLGWDSRKGNLWDVAPDMSIGGDRFGNYEGNLPKRRGRTYYECDVNYEGGFRNRERIVFSSDGLIYYTGDHYNSFTLLYEGWYENNMKYAPAA